MENSNSIKYYAIAVATWRRCRPFVVGGAFGLALSYAIPSSWSPFHFSGPVKQIIPENPQQLAQKKFLANESTMEMNGTPRSFDHGKPEFHVDPADNQKIMENPAQRRAFISTVMLIVITKANVIYGTGSGTVLSEFQVGGLPVILSIRHVTDLAANRIPGGSVVAVDRNGVLLGTIKQFSQKEHDGRDYPTLSYFDVNNTKYGHELNPIAIRAIPGVEIARHLPPGMIIGPADNNVIVEGSSGGGWYNTEGKLVGVIDANNLDDPDKSHKISVTATSPFNILLGITPKQETIDLPITGDNDIQSLAIGPALTQMAVLAKRNGVAPLHLPTPDLQNIQNGFGFPSQIPMFFKSHLTYNKSLADQATNNVMQQLTK